MITGLENVHIGVIGLGYVGLPLAVSFAKKYQVIGFDVDGRRIEELQVGHDRTREVNFNELDKLNHLTFTTNASDLDRVNFYIITTPTPVDEHRQPDMSYVMAASKSVAETMRAGDIVVYESTVYPGATEEECVPLLERTSGLKFNEDFFVGYSPERINPGDTEHRFENIVKITSGSNPRAAEIIDSLYSSVVKAGTFKTSSIRVAEAAKVIENTQRDINIALINELALVFEKLQIDTQEVLDAAGTKWNFLNFRPGLVGGHCIGVDPYYLTHKAQSVGHHPELILAGRRLNDSMGKHVANRLIRSMLQRGFDLRQARVLVLGLTFKENTPDLRNTKVIDVIRELETFGVAVHVFDPWVQRDESEREYNIVPVQQPSADTYDAIILAVAHEEFRTLGAEGIRKWGKRSGHILYDLKSLFPMDQSDIRL